MYECHLVLEIKTIAAFGREMNSPSWVHLSTMWLWGTQMVILELEFTLCLIFKCN